MLWPEFFQKLISCAARLLDRLEYSLTLEFLISVAPQINVPPEKFGRNNKHTPLK